MSQADRSAGPETNSGRVGSRSLSLGQFNRLPAAQAETLLRPCLDIDRWVRTLVDHRPCAQVDELIETARQAANPFTVEAVEDVLAHHPWIAIIAEQLRKIALLRLAGVVAP